MQIKFDPVKNAANIKERNLPFERVAEFDFNTAVVAQDTRKAYRETRLVAVGYLGDRLHVLCFAPLPTGLRVISFRKANSREIKDYETTHATHRR